VITAPNSDLNVTDGQTDRRTLHLLWHHALRKATHASHGKNQIAHVAVKERMGLKLFCREIIFEEFQIM